MGAAGFIARRLNARSTLAMSCIAVSFLVMIIAVAVSSGFREEIRDGIARESGDVRLIPIRQDYVGENSSIGSSPEYLERLSGIPGVESIEPVIYRAGLVKGAESIHGVMFKGVRNPSDTGSLAVSIPRRLASLLSLSEGDPMTAYFVGDRVKVRRFKVASVYDGIVESDDKLVVHASLEDLQRLNGWESGEISAFEIMTKPSMRTRRSLSRLEEEIGFVTSAYQGEDDEAVYASSSYSSYPQLFDWLDLIDFNVMFILILMTIVAGFNMISGLLIILFENISTIGLLKAVGMRDREIAKVFLLSSSRIVLVGMAIGNALALAFCLIQGSTHLLGLDPANYFVSYVPVRVRILSVLAADAVSYLAIMLLLLIPTMFISRVDPAETVKAN